MTIGRLGWAAIVAVLIGGVIAVLAVTITIKMDLSFFFPRSSEAVTQMVIDRFRDGPASRIVLIGISGAPAETLVDASDSLAKAMSASGEFSLVSNGRPPAPSEIGDLFTYRYLINPPIQANDFTVETLHAKLTAALRLLGTTLGAQLKQLMPADPTLRVIDILRYVRGSAEPHRVGGLWFTPDGRTALLVAQTTAPPFDYNAQARTAQWIHQAFDGIPGARGLRLEMTGPSMFAVEAHRLIESEVQWLNVFAFLAVMALIVAVFRTPFFIFPLMAPLLAGILVGAAAVQAIFGYVHGTSLAFGSTLMGVAIDYPLHLAIQARGTGGAKQAIERIWPTLRLSALTTIVAFGSLIFSTFPGLSQLGVIAVAGLVTAALMTRWVVPRILPAPGPRPIRFIRRPAVGRRLRVATGIATGVAVIAGLATLASRDGSLWQGDLAGLSPIPRAELARDREFRSAIGAADVSRLLVVAGASAEEILTRSETLMPDLDRLVRDGALGGFDMAAKLLPSAKAQKSRQRLLPSPDVLTMNLDQALSGLPFKPGYFDAFLRDVETARTAPPLTYDQIKPGLLGARIATLLFESGTGWVGLVSLSSIKDDNAVKGIAQSGSTPWLHYLDLKATSDEIAANYRWEALAWLGAGVVVALIVLLYGLKRFRSVVAVSLPVLGAIVLTAGLLASLGEPLSIFHLIGLLLVGGLGMDYGLFFNRREDDPVERQATFTSVALCCATTVMVFGILAVSSLPVLNNIGLTVAVGTLIAFALCFLLSSQHAPARP